MPEERLGRGAVPTLSLSHNLLLSRKDALGAGGWIRVGALKAQAADIIARYKVKANGPDAAAKSLSGGNLQKFIVGREIEAKPKLLILDEPTSVLTPQAVEKLFVVLRKLAAEGCSILYISHKLHEIRELCTACTVLRGGQVLSLIHI